MSVHELIELLKQVDQDFEVFVWVDGERYPATDIDLMNWYVDINTGESK